MSASNIQVNERVSDGKKLATELNGDEHTQKVCPADATGIPYSAANPQQMGLVGGIDPGSAPGNLGKTHGNPAGASDVGIQCLFEYMATPTAHGLANGSYLRARLDANGNMYITGTVAVSNGVPGLPDNTASNVTLGTTQGLGIMGFAEASPTVMTTSRAGLVSQTLYRQVRVASQAETGMVVIAGVPTVIKYAVVAASASGDNLIVAAVTSKKIRVLSAALSANAAVNAKWQSDATDKSGLYYFTDKGGVTLPYNEGGWFETVSGEKLDLNLSAAVAVGGHISYVEVP